MYAIKNICPGCGKCARGICPTKAITVKNNKAIIGQECINCGLCVPVCPIKAIKVVEDKDSNKSINEENKAAVNFENIADKKEEINSETSTGI